MRIPAISNTSIYQARPEKMSKVKYSQPCEQKFENSIYSKGFSNVCFGMNMIQDYIYEKSVVKHKHMINEINPQDVVMYCQSLGIPCAIDKGRTYKDNQVIAYLVFNAMEIMRQLRMPLPSKIDMESMPLGIAAACYYGPDIAKGYPIGALIYNREQDWGNYLDHTVARQKVKDKFLTSNHFLHTTIHECGHNVHYHKLFSKFGSPTPDSRFAHNPETGVLMRKLNMKPDGESPYITPEVRAIMKQSSGYGSSLLPELFAEEFARAIVNDMDFMTLRLVRNPFPIRNLSPELHQVLHETWEGLIDDGQGMI